MPRHSILLLICDPVMIDIYKKRFEIDGWDVESAQTVEEAQRKAQRISPSVLFLDARCELSILALIKHFNGLPTTSESRFVLYAPELNLELIEKAKAAGVHDFVLSKHVIPQEIVKNLRRKIKP